MDWVSGDQHTPQTSPSWAVEVHDFMMWQLWRSLFCCGPFWSGHFCHKVHEKFFLFAPLNFQVYHKNFFCLFSIFFWFQKQSKIFCLFLLKLLSILHKKYKFKHTATIFLFGYSSNIQDYVAHFPWTSIYCGNLCVNQPLKVTFSRVAVV